MHSGRVMAAIAAELADVTGAEARRLLARLAEANLLSEEAPGLYTLTGLVRDYAAELPRGTPPTTPPPTAVPAAGSRGQQMPCRTSCAAASSVGYRRSARG